MKRQRRQYSIWWPGRMAAGEAPVHCAPSYTVGAQKLLAHPACREALGVTSQPSPGAAGPSSSSDPGGAAGPLSGTKRPAGDGGAAGGAAAGAGPSYPKRTRAADPPEAPAPAPAAPAAAPEEDVKQPLAALAAAAGLAPLSPGCSANAIAAAAAAAVNKHQGPVPGSEVLQAVKQYTGSTKEVQGKVKAALQQLTEAIKLVGDAKNWSAESIKALPGGAALAAGLDTRSLGPLISEAQEMHESLAADAAQLETMLAGHASSGRAAAGSSGGGSGRTRGGAAEASYRKPLVAFRSALEACEADTSAWLRQQSQQDTLQRLQAVSQVKALVESNKELKQQLAQAKRQLQEQQQQQSRSSSVSRKRKRQRMRSCCLHRSSRSSCSRCSRTIMVMCRQRARAMLSRHRCVLQQRR
ncbi:hypothetical protein COO60DRAFT_784368 [Scenedesmus sp. NREL 46B-D3]|nr:hypothetical protein COO60DRAFT_784368 [Scenedesmus sp. NREL 46B-D3]